MFTGKLRIFSPWASWESLTFLLSLKIAALNFISIFITLPFLQIWEDIAILRQFFTNPSFHPSKWEYQHPLWLANIKGKVMLLSYLIFTRSRRPGRAVGERMKGDGWTDTLHRISIFSTDFFYNKLITHWSSVTSGGDVTEFSNDVLHRICIFKKSVYSSSPSIWDGERRSKKKTRSERRLIFEQQKTGCVSFSFYYFILTGQECV